MSYKIVAPSTYSNLPAPNDYLEIEVSPSQTIKNTEDTDTFYNPIPIIDTSSNLHSLIQNKFFIEFLDAIKEEQQQKREYFYVLDRLYDTSKYFGDMVEFNKRINNLFTMLNISLIPEVLDNLKTYYYESDFTVSSELTNAVDVRVRWLQDIIDSVHLMKKWAGTVKGYSFLYKSIYQNGFVFLRAGYSDTGSFSEYTGKYFKILNFFALESSNNYISRFLPNTLNSFWPISKGAKAVQNYSLLKNMIYYQYDANRLHDENNGNPNALRYDNGIKFGTEGKGIIVELNADKILIHKNSLGTNECLMDISWLNYVDSLKGNVEQASTDIMIGTQVSLVAQKTGKYIYDPISQVLNGVKYTHPNIKAKFQIIKDNWESNAIVEKIRIGTGSYSTAVFSDDTESVKPFPTDLQNPVFEAVVGVYERNNINGYSCVSTMIHPLSFKDESLTSLPFTISKSETPLLNVETMTVELPHTSIARGKSRFVLNFNFPVGETTFKRSILLQEVYDKVVGSWVLAPSIYDDHNASGNLLTGLELKKVNEYFNDDDFSNTEFFPSSYQDIITLQPVSTVNNIPLYAVLDNLTGNLSFKLQIRSDSIVSGFAPYDGIGTFTSIGSVVCSYTTNFSKGSSVEVTGITEVGLFNTEGDMVAYGTFPPIIYDTEKYHISFNCLLELPIT